MALPPGPPLPAAAQTLMYLLRPIEYLAGCHRRYGDVFTIRTLLFGTEICVVRPDDIKQVFTSDPDVLRAGEANGVLEPLLGSRSVLLLDGEEHLRQRRLMMPPFHGERMLAYAETMREVAARVVEGWPEGKPFSLHASMQRITLDIILRTIFGVDDGSPMDELRSALGRVLDRSTSPVASLLTAPAFRVELGGLSPWAAFRREVGRADALVYAQIARRREERRRGAVARGDVLEMLLDARDEAGHPMTDVELRDELTTLLVAGHETTATMLCWAFDQILHDRRVHDRLLEELDGIAGGGVPSPTDLGRLEYLDATIKEVLRLRPVIPAVGRKLTEPMEIGGMKLPAGILVVPSTYLTHRLPAYYPDPEAFRPERFLGNKPDPYAWLPFGGGTRRCLGMAFALYEMKVVMATVLAMVRLRAARPEPAEVTLRGFTYAPAGGAEVIVTGRRGALGGPERRAA